MPSFQNGAPGAKNMKFVDALNPFTPFLAQPGDNEPEEQDPGPLTQQFDNRLRLDASSSRQPQPHETQQQQQQQQQQEHYAEPEPTASEPRAPMSAYDAISQTIQNKKRSKKKKSSDGEKDISDDEDEADDHSNNKNNNDNDSDDDNDDDEFDYLLDDDDDDEDAILRAIRQKRLRELQTAHQKESEHKAKGHGELRTISQDEFLAECTSSRHVVVHFFHTEFEKCGVMDHHLKQIASNPKHLSCKFVRIDAEKAPFFVVKLKIQTLPTVIVFRDGKSVERLVGFEGLVKAKATTGSSGIHNMDDFPTSRLGYWLESIGAIEYEGPGSDDEDENEDADREKDTRRGRNRVYDVDV